MNRGSVRDRTQYDQTEDLYGTKDNCKKLKNREAMQTKRNDSQS